MGYIQSNVPEWADFYNPIAGGTYFGIVNGDYVYKHKHAPIINGCSALTYEYWTKQPDTVSVIKIQENE